jgi:hypothetical protein
MRKHGFAAAGGVLLVLAGGAQAGSVSPSVTVSGDVATPGVYKATALQALPPTTETETYTSAGTPVTDTFTGPTLNGLLTAAGGVVVNPAVKNDILNKYIVATGSDGYQAVFSAGEISPKFGARPDLVAISDASNTLPSPNGVARIVAAGDVAGGRYVSNVTGLFVGSAPIQPATGGGDTSSFVVQGGVTSSATFGLSQLEALTPHTETVTYMLGSTPVTDTYTGALLWDVLSAEGILTDPTIKNDILRKLVTADGSDGYNVEFSLGEIDPAFGDDPVLVAYSDTDGQFSGGGGDGFARIVAPGDIAGGRYVSNLASLTVFDGSVPVPEPSSFALLGVGALGLGLVRRRKPE